MNAPASSHAELPRTSSWTEFAAIYREHYELVWRCALRMGSDPADVADVVQETFMVALRRFDEFDPDRDGKASSWLYAILRNVLRNHARGERRRKARLEAFAVQPRFGATVRGDAKESLSLRLLEEFLAELDEDKREVFVLAELEGFSGPEIADALALNVNTAQSRLRAARKAFSQRFAEGPSSRTELIRSHRVSAPKAARRKTWSALVLAAPKLGFGGTTLGVLGIGKWALGLGLATSMLVAAVVGTEGWLDAQAGGEVASASPSAVDASAAPERSVAVSGADELAEIDEPDEPVEPVLVVAPARPSPAKPQPARTEPDSLESLRRLASARKALVEGRADDALAELREQSWPQELADSAAMLELGALCRSGRAEQVRERVAEFSAAHPDHADELARHCDR